MTPDHSTTPSQPNEPVQRRATDTLWFAVLFLSIATGIGMTIFAPVGDDPPPAVSTTLPSLPAATTTTDPVTQPSTLPATVPLQ